MTETGLGGGVLWRNRRYTKFLRANAIKRRQRWGTEREWEEESEIKRVVWAKTDRGKTKEGSRCLAGASKLECFMLIPLQKQHLTLSSHVLIFWTAERSSASTGRSFINVICRGYLRDDCHFCSFPSASNWEQIPWRAVRTGTQCCFSALNYLLIFLQS